MKIESLGAELKPLREKIAAIIRDSVIEGKLKPGERLTEPEIASTLGVSRTPIREALLQLESEGFVVVHPRRGAVVTELSFQDAEEMYVVKGALEALAAKLAADFIKDEDYENLLRINQQMEKIALSETKNYKRFLDLNSRFHQSLYDLSNNTRLIKTITALRNQTLRYNYIYVSILSHLHESVMEHYKIIELLRAKKTDELEQIIKKHGDTARKALYEFIKKTNKKE